ncbi:hypothetical protein CEXT_367041 [Caerostris extrusa]|uniref:Uncharacterized protein n=1 Tax=Caerostris extrusa TaxID=172846 RepID=A0AAV4NHA3_CAEEX|nr:hypothetical protein CEXT_367041 [Caerostris extrusa]
MRKINKTNQKFPEEKHYLTTLASKFKINKQSRIAFKKHFENKRGRFDLYQINTGRGKNGLRNKKASVFILRRMTNIVSRAISDQYHKKPIPANDGHFSSEAESK